MICNRCVSNQVCRYKDKTEEAEDVIKTYYPHIEIDCKHRELATQEQLNRMKIRERE